MTYIFRNGAEFCSWLDTKADDIRERAEKASRRSVTAKEATLLKQEAFCWNDLASMLRDTSFTGQSTEERLDSRSAVPFVKMPQADN